MYLSKIGILEINERSLSNPFHDVQYHGRLFIGV